MTIKKLYLHVTYSLEETTLHWIQAELDPIKKTRTLSKIGDANSLFDLNTSVFDDITALLPTQDILLTTVKLPVIKPHQLRQAVQFAIQEQLATPVEACHLAIGKQAATGEVPVAIVNQDKMHQWLTLFKEYDLTPQALYPDVYALPIQDQGWCIWRDQQRCLIRTQAFEGYSVTPQSEINLLNTLLKEKHTKRITCYAKQSLGESSNTRLPTIDSLKLDGIEINEQAQQPLLLLAANDLHTKHLINLAQASFKTQKKPPQINAWKITAVSICTWFIFSITLALLDITTLKQHETSLQRKISSLYRQVFPHAHDIVSPYFRFHQAIKTLQDKQAGDHFLRLLQLTAPTLLRQEKVALKTLEYNRNHLTYTITANHLESITTLMAALKKLPIHLNQEQINSHNNTVIARIDVTSLGRKP